MQDTSALKPAVSADLNGQGANNLILNASVSNAIYGNSNTVQTSSNQNLIIIKF